MNYNYPIPVVASKKQDRFCLSCGKKNQGLYPKCNACRQAECKHDRGSHYDSGLAFVCNQCGKVLKARLKAVGFTKRAQEKHQEDLEA